LPQSLTLSNFNKVKIKEDRRRTDIGPDGIELDTVMADMERDYILKAMEMAQGSKQGAAELLGITVDSIKYRLTKLNR
jgi:two-component system response regulator PilR (NtrC family)